MKSLHVAVEDLTSLDGIGEYSAGLLKDAGLTTRADVRRALVELEPGANGVYSSRMLDLIDDLGLNAAGAERIAQYELVNESPGQLSYRWDRSPDPVTIEYREDGGRFYFKIREGEQVLRSGTYDTEAKAQDAVTRWTHRPREVLDE